MLTFKERHDIPVYHPDVRVFEAFDKDGSSLALFYADLLKRDDKVGGAWTSTIIEQSALLGTKPLALTICNFSKPGPNQPALISQDNVTTLFHEFGHVLHGIFSRVKYPYFSGMSAPRDFVEFPSQLNEHWATEPRVLANYAKHFRTGEAMPATLLAKIQRAQKYGQGYATSEHVAAALLDQDWHDLPADAPIQDVGRFESEALERFGAENPLIPPRYRSSYFSHIWEGGYSARYYAYTWTAVLRDDAFYWFKEHGGMTSENGERFRDIVLSRGGTEEADTLYREFTGHDPRVEPMLAERGLTTSKR